jgi:hypothetical protein
VDYDDQVLGQLEDERRTDTRWVSADLVEKDSQHNADRDHWPTAKITLMKD